MVSRLVIVVGGLALACGDNVASQPPEDASHDPDVAVTDDASPDVIASPDLRWVASMMDNSLLIMPGTFTAASCELEEQCIGAEGTRRLLHFDAVSENAGTADLVVGPPPADGVSDSTFTWSACHDHHHFNNYAVYELHDANGVVVTGRKQAFCIRDSIPRQVGKPSNGYTCQNQGLTAGWADVYARGLSCQWLDITGLPAGEYTLRTIVNPDGVLPDADMTNNVYETIVTLP